MLKLAISNIAWRKEEDEEVYAVLQKYSIHDLEIAPARVFEFPNDVSLEHVKQFQVSMEKLNLQIVAFQALLFGKQSLTIFESQTILDETISYLSSICSLAQRLGAKILVFGSPKNRLIGDLEKRRAMEIAVNAFARLGEIARTNGLIFCIEPNSTDYGCDFVTNVTDAIDLVQQVNHPGFRLHVDSGVMTMNGENYESTLDAAMPYMSHFHISEPFLKPITNFQTDHSRLGKILKAQKYEGTVSIEMVADKERSNLETVEKSLFLAREYYLDA